MKTPQFLAAALGGIAIAQEPGKLAVVGAYYNIDTGVVTFLESL